MTSTVYESKAVKTSSTVSTILKTIQTRTNSLSSSTAIGTSSGLPTSRATVQDSTVSVTQGISIQSHDQSLCSRRDQPTVQVCTNDGELNVRSVIIVNFSALNNHRTSCECVITPFTKHVPVNFILSNSIVRYILEIQTNYTKMSKSEYISYRTNLTAATKFVLSTEMLSSEEKREGDGVCMAVYSEDGSKFNVSCTRQTSETTIHSSPASISQGVDTSSKTSLSPTQFSIQSSTGKDSKLSAVIVPSVSATGGFIFGIVIVASCTLFYKRKRKGNINSTTTRSTNVNVEGDYYMTSHNDFLRKSTNRKLSSEDSADGKNNKATLDIRGDQHEFSNAEGEDEAEYDSTKEKFEQGANEHYNHMSSIV